MLNGFTYMTSFCVSVPVSKPRLWPLSPLADRPTCWGQPATVRCGCTRGTAVRYTWFQNAHGEDILLHHSSDLHLHCGTVDEGGEYYCIAGNDVSSQRSDVLSVQVLTTADSSCIYVIIMQGKKLMGWGVLTCKGLQSVLQSPDRKQNEGP